MSVLRSDFSRLKVATWALCKSHSVKLGANTQLQDCPVQEEHDLGRRNLVSSVDGARAHIAMGDT
jgi:hypothetical protein